MRSYLLAITLALRGAFAASMKPGTFCHFSESCDNIKIVDNFFLSATCRDETLSYKHANTLDLNLCIGINQTTANLLWEPYGKIANYCTDCALVEGSSIACQCSPLVSAENNAPTQSYLDLDTGIGNDNGTLTCSGGIGSFN
ncbi:hypothetical protein B0T26DRAFT_648878 [Lasiosphaeria miniovina]|uniref:Cyanovirin-N domain-containing protein n=1 Tax=Lasiosphaeria miniovina TaxID=1954250 RepID=A0AA40ABV5_9PEZI|nr:uncharacterized protein B0T26DRAFT_648878 [Lasiosphaeria miniovina]KAK0712914.1 hypothetical protein B0T26DRAFT_648878 [Lasiosphaeria miniovina]